MTTTSAQPATCHPYPITVIEHNFPGIGATSVARALHAIDKAQNIKSEIIEVGSPNELRHEVRRLKRLVDNRRIAALPPLIVVAWANASTYQVDWIIREVYGHGRTRTIALIA